MRYLKYLIVPIIAMSIIVLISNILVQFLLGNWLTWGALTYPFAFLVTDLTNRFYGLTAARKVVLFGFIIGIFCSLIGTQLQSEFGPLVTLRIALGSATAFILSQFIDISIFNSLRKEKWWKAPLISSILGSLLDTIIFFFIAFSSFFIFLEPLNDVSWAAEHNPVLGLVGSAPFWVSLAIADFLVKLSIISISLIPFRYFILFLKIKENI
ncbi:MAG: queuosine precursor transporter [Paracoccaceae bacterium]